MKCKRGVVGVIGIQRVGGEFRVWLPAEATGMEKEISLNPLGLGFRDAEAKRKPPLFIGHAHGGYQRIHSSTSHEQPESK